MLFFSNKNVVIKTLYLFSVLVFLLLWTFTVQADEEFSVVFRDFTKEEETRKNKIGEDKLLILNYNGVIKKESVIVEHMPSSITFAKAVMCGNSVYPSVLVKKFGEKTSKKYIERNLLLIYNEQLEEITSHRESTVVSNKTS